MTKAEPPTIFERHCRDNKGLVHGAVYVGEGFSQWLMTWCSGWPADDFEYEDEDEPLTCIACAGGRRIE